MNRRNFIKTINGAIALSFIPFTFLFPKKTNMGKTFLCGSVLTGEQPPIPLQMEDFRVGDIMYKENIHEPQQDKIKYIVQSNPCKYGIDPKYGEQNWSVAVVPLGEY